MSTAASPGFPPRAPRARTESGCARCRRACGPTVADLLEDLQVTRSHSRPKQSNDNPYSEAWFKTLKYAPVFPDRFDSLAHARQFMTDFTAWYNECHRHTGIGMHTPSDVHHHRHEAVRARRHTTLATARAAHPERFTTPNPLPKILDLPHQVWINKPKPQDQPQTA